MKRNLRREILIETEQIIFLRKKSKANYPICEICEDEQLMIPPSLIAEILKISSREIYRRIETDKKRIHFIENDSFQIFICPNSLAKSLKQKGKLLH